MLKNSLSKKIEAGVDEVGRGPIAGSVFAAAVILPSNFFDPRLDDSKRLSPKKRYALREVICREAIAWAVAEVSPSRIDKINILQATMEAMNEAIAKLSVKPDRLVIDGPYFNTTSGIEYQCIIGGDGKFASIAAASVLAKTFRDDQMMVLHEQYPQYNWAQNKGYPTPEHREAILKHGVSPYHRRTFASVLEFI